MNFEAIPDLLADIIAEQRRTTEAVVGLAQALAGIRAKVEAERAAAQTAKVEKTTKAAVDTSVDTPATAAEVDYEAAKKAVLALIKSQGREAAVAVLASYNLKSLQDAKPEQWGPIVQSIAKAAQ